MATIDELVKRLTTPYVNDVGSNNYKLLSIAAEQIDDLLVVQEDVRKANNVEEATGVSLDEHGELIACFRHTSESDNDYRNRLEDWLHSLIGGGTVEQLQHTVRKAIPGITDDDFEIIDGYTTTGHGDPNHYAHLKVRINIGFAWTVNNLWEMLQKARAAAITIDEMGPLAEETLDMSEEVTLNVGLFKSDTISMGETFVKEVGRNISESQDISEVSGRDGSACHYADITRADSLNYLCS